jgi:hypothetical protein
LASLARTLRIEAAHSYRFPARVARHKLAAVDVVPEVVRAIAWKAQTRFCQRYRHMMAKGKPRQVVVTAIAREVAGFIWSIACVASDPPTTDKAVTVSHDRLIGVSVDVVMASERGRQTSPTDRSRTGTSRGGRPGANQCRIGRREPDGMIVHYRTD